MNENLRKHMEDEHTENTGEGGVPLEAIQAVDPASFLPGSEIMGISAHGASFWTRTARLDTILDGAKQSYFLKTSFGELGNTMMSSEYHCMNKIHAVMPDLVPKTIAWGSYSSIPDVHFFLADFRPMTDELPDIEAFPAKMAELHRSATSPDGRFGFDVTTFHGETPIEHGWSDTWEDYFSRTTKVLFELEQDAQGANEEIRELMVPFFNELAVWRQPWNKIGKPYRMQYHEHFPMSQPQGDYDDRNALYATRVNILDSILYKENPSYREMLISSMKELVGKFPGGLEEWKSAQIDRL
ncbi:hypothetical protein PG991_010649 [Apiospora marii]|uniref:protein-ribulosamine 3-kinase n=1 Tax=Apiospora marii TaxID=335849 RepID=A0ABR1RBZ2_9PEZI